MAEGKSDRGHGPESEKAEDRIIEAGQMTVEEMQDSMVRMVEASTKMMQAFIDMRLSYLKVMRAGLEDPQATLDMMMKNARGMADLSKSMSRKQD